ncbi:hypothetical protein [Maridesulfovibrio sp.]|uniref:hypothetical protein n=1 Tax=Maridesulfovibrio sp. TaxID=2795000 RepID=UPI002A18E26D|nr:hypothetical protein [Maridesulfovibrio sp.]
MKFIARTLILSLLLIFVLASVVGAATINGQNWYNESPGVHTMQIWVVEPDVSIKSVKFKNGESSLWSWKYVDDTKSSVIMTGPKASGVNAIRPDFQFTSPYKKYNFSVEWAELSQGNTLTGTNFYIDKKWKYTKGDISHTPTPIPGAVLLFAGGLSVLAFIRRKFFR